MAPKIVGTAAEKVQIILPRKHKYLRCGAVSLEEQLSFLDFTVTRAALLDRASGLVDSDFLKDEADMKLVVKHVVDPVTSVIRIGKYTKKGYSIQNAQAVKLFIEWSHRASIEPNVLEAPDDTGEGSGSTDDDKDIPPSFICPITQDIMRDPVITVDGQTYERAAISEWLQKNDTSPLTMKRLPHKVLITAYALRSAIEDLFPPSDEDEAPRHHLNEIVLAATCANMEEGGFEDEAMDYFRSQHQVVESYSTRRPGWSGYMYHGSDMYNGGAIDWNQVNRRLLLLVRQTHSAQANDICALIMWQLHATKERILDGLRDSRGYVNTVEDEDKYYEAVHQELKFRDNQEQLNSRIAQAALLLESAAPNAGVAELVPRGAAPSAPESNASPAAVSSAPTRSLYVGGLAPECSEARLYEKFSEAGPITSIRVCRDATTRRCLGYGFINYENPDHAKFALENFNFQPMCGRPMRVSKSMRDPSKRPPRRLEPAAPAQPAAPAPAVRTPGQEPLNASAFAAASNPQQKQMLGERLFPLIQNTHPDLAGKITGMLLEMDNSELLHLLEDKTALDEKVQEAVQVLQDHSRAQATGQP